MSEERDFRKSMRIGNGEEISYESPSNIKARRLYEEFVTGQKEQFISFINYLNYYVNSLREEGIISDIVQFRARIKSPVSTLINDRTKGLDDIFGIEFLALSDEEIQIVKKELEKILYIWREKDKKKDNGYHSIHCLYGIKKQVIEKLNERSRENGKIEFGEEGFPAVEIQYKTMQMYWEANYGKASHEKYKKVNIPEMQKMYDSGQLMLGEYLPYMWISDKEHDEVKELPLEEVIKKMYPSLKVNKSKEERDEK